MKNDKVAGDITTACNTPPQSGGCSGNSENQSSQMPVRSTQQPQFSGRSANGPVKKEEDPGEDDGWGPGWDDGEHLRAKPVDSFAPSSDDAKSPKSGPGSGGRSKSPRRESDGSQTPPLSSYLGMEE